MSRTDAHRPLAVLARDPKNWKYIVVHTGPFDPSKDKFDWAKVWWYGPQICGCRMCTGHYWYKQERKANRAAWKKLRRNILAEVDRSDVDEYTGTVVKLPKYKF